MAGKFEAYLDQDALFRFRLLGPDGAVMAVSGPFDDKAALAAGIAAVRECAGTGLVTDLCPAGAVASPVPVVAPAPAPADCGDRRAPATQTFILAKEPRREGTRPRWTATIRR